MHLPEDSKSKEVNTMRKATLFVIVAAVVVRSIGWYATSVSAYREGAK